MSNFQLWRWKEKDIFKKKKQGFGGRADVCNIMLRHSATAATVELYSWMHNSS